MGDVTVTVVAADLMGRVGAILDEVTETRTAYRLAITRRDALMRAMWDEGYSEVAIARVFRLDRRTVRGILLPSGQG